MVLLSLMMAAMSFSIILSWSWTIEENAEVEFDLIEGDRGYQAHNVKKL